MWFVYRMPGRFAGWVFSTPLSDYLESLAPKLTGDPDWDEELERKSIKAIRTTERDLEVAQVTARQVSWDGTLVGQPHVIGVPAFDGLRYGFIWKQASLGMTFLASPVDLEHLHNDIDWDARTDSEALDRAKNALQGKEKKPARVTPWITSKNGNQTRMDGTYRVTTFKNKRGGYGVIVSDVNDKKVFGKDSPTEQEAMDYADENIETLKEACK